MQQFLGSHTLADCLRATQQSLAGTAVKPQYAASSEGRVLRSAADHQSSPGADAGHQQSLATLSEPGRAQ